MYKRQALLLILPLVVAVLALCIGRLGISPAEVIRSVFGKITGDVYKRQALVVEPFTVGHIVISGYFYLFFLALGSHSLVDRFDPS